MSREKVINAWQILVDKILLRVAKGKKMFFKKCFPRLRREYRAGEMVQWLRALNAFPEDPGSFPRTAQWLTAVVDTVLGCLTLSSTLQGYQAWETVQVQAKHPYTSKTNTPWPSIVVHAFIPPTTLWRQTQVDLRPAQATASYRPLKATQWDNKLIN